MSKLLRLVALIALVVLIVWMPGCAVSDDGFEPYNRYETTPRVEHVVVCWLKNHGSDVDQRRLVATSYGFLLREQVPGLVDVRAGKVRASTRPAVDSSFDVAIVMTFADEAALARYGQSPVHQQAIRDVLKPLVDHYMVYDFTSDEMRRK